MGRYDVQQVCLNGHQINPRTKESPEFSRKFCASCGAKAISQCPSCSHPIRGEYISEGVVVVGFRTAVPERCDNCGGEFPWTGKEEAAIVQVDAGHALERICLRFHAVATQLRHRHDERQGFEIVDEYDVQDLMHALLRLYFDDVRPEEWTPSYAGASSRMDFLLKSERIVVETKMARRTLGARQVGEQLIVDGAKYKEHPDCRRLFCFVYDPGDCIRNPTGIERDLSGAHNGVDTRVIIAPKR